MYIDVVWVLSDATPCHCVWWEISHFIDVRWLRESEISWAWREFQLFIEVKLVFEIFCTKTSIESMILKFIAKKKIETTRTIFFCLDDKILFNCSFSSVKQSTIQTSSVWFRGFILVEDYYNHFYSAVFVPWGICW